MKIPRYVLDSNIVIGWFEDQLRPTPTPNLHLLDLIQQDQIYIIAPTFLLLELLNILIRRYHVEVADAVKFINWVLSLPVEWIALDFEWITTTAKTMSKYQLSSYDALFIWCAEQHDCQVVTHDKKLLLVKDRAVNPAEI